MAMINKLGHIPQMQVEETRPGNHPMLHKTMLKVNKI